MRRISLQARIGIALIMAGLSLYGGWRLWRSSRTWVPLDIPISLAPGHIRSREFKINMTGGYWIGVEVERGFDFNGAPCLLGFNDEYKSYKCTGTPSIFEATWSVSSGGKVVAHGTSHVVDWWMSEDTTYLDRGIGALNGQKGQRYVLDVDILQDASRLNAGHPHLGLVAFGNLRLEYNQREEIVQIIAVLLLGQGAVLLFRLRRKKADYTRVSLTESGPARQELRVAARTAYAGGDRSPAAKRGWWASPTIWAGIGLTCVGVIFGTSIKCWMATRTFIPVDMPISTTPGRIKTGPFRVNLRDRYSIRLGNDIVDLPDTYETWMRYDEIREFNARCDTGSLPRTHWVLYHNGRIIAQSLSQGPDLGYFMAEKGIYAVEIEILSDASCLAPLHPKLQVSTSNSDYTDYANPLLSLSALLAVVGLSILTLSRVSQSVDLATWTVSLGGAGPIGGYFQWARKYRRKSVFGGLPPFGLFAVFTLFCVWVPVVVLFKWTIPPHGLKVHLVTPQMLSAKVESALPAVVVQLKYDRSGGPQPKLYLNSRVVSLPSLENELKKELRTQPNWVVYFEGDPSLPWGAALQVIDIIRGVPAEVVLLTPSSKRGALPLPHAVRPSGRGSGSVTMGGTNPR